MKSLFIVALIGSVSGANRTLEEVYGPAAPVDEMLSWAERSPSRTKIASDYFNVRRPENCIFPLDVVILQDATASFQDDYAFMRDTQLRLMVEALNTSHPESKFSVVSFRDKPIYSLGDVSDYCQRFESPLSSNISALNAVYDRLVSTGGADPAENQFGAIVAATQSQTPGWSSSSSTSTRLVVLSTDAMPHFADDGMNKYGMKPFSGRFDEPKAEAQCLEEYYPSPEQMKQALFDRNAYLAQLIFDGDWMNGLVRRSWEWTNNYIGQTPDFLEPLANDASNFWTALAKIIETIEDAECIDQTTLEPTTTTETTTDEEVSPLGTTEQTVQSTTDASEETECPPNPCPPCPCPPTEVCPPCPCEREGVLIKLLHRPKRLHLEIENDPESE